MEINKNLEDKEKINKNLLEFVCKDSDAIRFEEIDEDIERAKREIYNFVREKLRYPITDSSNSEENLLGYQLIALRKMKQNIEKEIKKSRGPIRYHTNNLLDYFSLLDYIISTKDNAKVDQEKSLESSEILAEIDQYKFYIETKDIDCSKISFKEFLENDINVELDKVQIRKYVEKNLRYPQKDSDDIFEKLLAYKCEFLQKIRFEFLEEKRKSDVIVKEPFEIISFFADLDYITSLRTVNRNDNSDSLSQYDRVKTASEILSKNKKLVLEILSLKKEIKDMYLKISHNNQKIEKLCEEYRLNEQEIEKLMNEEEKKQPKI